MINYDDFYWKHNRLYLKDKDQRIFLEESDNHEGMYYIVALDIGNAFTKDFFNLTRAKDNAVKFMQSKLNAEARSEIEGRKEPVG